MTGIPRGIFRVDTVGVVRHIALIKQIFGSCQIPAILARLESSLVAGRMEKCTTCEMKGKDHLRVVPSQGVVVRYM